MDFFTHFLVPYIILFALKSKNKLEGGLGGISPDLDTLFVVWVGFLVPYLFVFTHRGITHSIVFAAISSTLVLYVISRKSINDFLSKIVRRDLTVEFIPKTIGIAYFGALTHLFLDFLTSRGIPLLYPFTLQRFSAEIYYYIDLTTAVIALAVLLILYLRVDMKYKKAAMAIFMIILISFGGIRAYEKNVALDDNPVEGGMVYSAAYPTMDLFTWTVVQSDPSNQTYYSFDYNTRTKEKKDAKMVQSLTVSGGTVQSAQEAINRADRLTEVQKFRWNVYYTCINASFNGKDWTLTYFDVIDGGYRSENLTVTVN